MVHRVTFVDGTGDSREHEHEVKSPESLLALLDAIDEEFSTPDCRIGVDVINPKGDKLHIGLGPESWSVAESRMDGDFPVEQHYGVGDPCAKGVVLFRFGEPEETPRKWLMPEAVARRVVIHWFQTAERSGEIEWSSDPW